MICEDLQVNQIPDSYDAYFNAFGCIAAEYAQAFVNNPSSSVTRKKMKQLTFYGVKVILAESKQKVIDMINASLHLVMVDYISDVMSELSLKEFLAIFPIDKPNHGKQRQTEHNLLAMERLHEIGMDNPLGKNMPSLLKEYPNNDIHQFFIEIGNAHNEMQKLNDSLA
jgi:hypothetical protein